MIVYLLDHTGKKETPTRFWIDWSKNWRGIIETKRASEEQAGEIIKTLRSSLSSSEAMHFCGHDPVYGIEAKDQDGKILKTSLCFTCLTWVKPDLRLDITGKRGPENELCKLLRAVIELPPELLEEKVRPPAPPDPSADKGNAAAPADPS